MLKLFLTLGMKNTIFSFDNQGILISSILHHIDFFTYGRTAFFAICSSSSGSYFVINVLTVVRLGIYRIFSSLAMILVSNLFLPLFFCNFKGGGSVHIIIISCPACWNEFLECHIGIIARQTVTSENHHQKNNKSTTQKVRSLSLIGQLQSSCPCHVDVANHTYRTQTKGFYITCKVSVYPVYTSTVFNGVYTKQGKVDQRAQQSQVQTVTRQNTKSTTQRVRSVSLCSQLQTLAPVSSMSQTTHIKLKPKDCILFVKSLYIQVTPQLFSTASIPNKVRQTSTPNSHK